ncbi:protein CcmA, bactofilin family [Gemmobacter aquatilis]|uniref:Protein CcmA, bactofilin family n=1 Tax=Gemmobacter aquatilis TaxID=933059 RepID=A0A1H8NMS9_9RHOB|nr:polymer-forming cytoskeletal protein [Gemmobacter aquatilis]SEO30904.1 protein CcmA, bactofilin family [Gemmobacter aquatilis]
MTQPAESYRSAPPAGRSVIAQDVRIKGDLGADGTVEVMGEVEGKINARTLVVGAEGRVKGSVTADTVDLRGSVEGKITCISLTLRSAAQVKADIVYTTVAIESGATIEGRFIRTKG